MKKATQEPQCKTRVIVLMIFRSGLICTVRLHESRPT